MIQQEDYLSLMNKISKNKLTGVEYSEDHIKNKKRQSIFGVLSTQNFKCVTESGETLTISRMQKSAPESEYLRMYLPFRKAYEREMYFYTKVVPAFNMVQKKEGKGQDVMRFAKYVDGNLYPMEYIIMENMTSPNYNFVYKDPSATLDFKHATFAAREYGRLHGLSYVLKHLYPFQYNELELNMKDEYFRMFETSNINLLGLNTFTSYALAAVQETTKKEPPKNLQFFLETIFDDVKLIVRMDNSKISVIGHGDCNVSNFLFKYEDSKKQVPTEMIMLDWQLSRIGSPALDLSCLLFMATDKALRDKHYDDLIRSYHSSLSECLLKYHLNVESWLTLKQLKEELKKYSMYGVFMAIMKLYIYTAQEHNVPEFSQINSTTQLDQAYRFFNTNIASYNVRISDILSDFMSKGYDQHLQF